LSIVPSKCPPFIHVGGGNDDQIDRDAEIAKGLAEPDELGAPTREFGLDDE
jgi:hypothetical protein